MITVSDSAKAQLAALWKKNCLNEENESAVQLKIFVKGAGCQGLRYGIILNRLPLEESDTLLEIQKDMLPIVVDAISLYYLNGAQLDFEESLQKSGFSVTNPTVSTTCACGTSFKI